MSIVDILYFIEVLSSIPGGCMSNFQQNFSPDKNLNNKMF